MDPEDIESYRQCLETEIAAVKALIEELKSASRPVTLDNSIGRLSRMDAINNKSIVENSPRANGQKLLRL